MSTRKKTSFLPLSTASTISTWSGLSSGANQRVLSIESQNTQNNIYAGGIFTSIGGVLANRIAKWDGNTWSALGSGLNNSVLVMKADNSNNLYVGGTFSTAGGVSVNNISVYDMSNNIWNSLGTGTNNSVIDMKIINNELYICGSFTTAGDISANRIAKWNGNTWSALTDSITGQNGLGGPVYSMTFDLSGMLWVVGNFSSAGGNYALFIAKWDGSRWSSFNANTFNQTPTSIVVDNLNNLYVGGYFTTVTNSGNPPITANYLAKLSGGIWSPIVVNGVNGVNNIVNVLNYRNNKLYVGGDFSSSGDISTNYFSVYNGNTWNKLNSSFNDQIAAINFSYNNDDVYVGGLFTQPYNHIAKYSENSTTGVFYLPIVKLYKKI
jgi:hypothetical protein